MTTTNNILRPTVLNDFVGNVKAIAKIKDRINDCRKLNNKFPNTIIFGPSGHGKSLLAELLSNELDTKFIYFNATAIIDPYAFREALKVTAKHSDSLVMIDECHELPKVVQTNALSLLEYPSILCTPGHINEYTDRITKKLGYITKERLPDGAILVFATTDPSRMKEAFIQRLFKINLFEYSNEEKAEIAKRAVIRAGMTLHKEAANEIAQRTQDIRDIAKVCEVLVNKAIVKHTTIISYRDVINVFITLDIDEYGCGETERKVLRYLAISEMASAESVSASIRMSRKDFISRVEPFLIRKGFLKISTGGRSITKKGAAVLSKTVIKETKEGDVRDIR